MINQLSYGEADSQQISRVNEKRLLHASGLHAKPLSDQIIMLIVSIR